MKYLIFIVFLVLSGTANSDVYQLCQGQIDNVRQLSKYPVENLIKYKRILINASTLEELKNITGKDYYALVPGIQDHQGISVAEAEKKALSMSKSIEIERVSAAIRMDGQKFDEATWSALVDECVNSNR